MRLAILEGKWKRKRGRRRGGIRGGNLPHGYSKEKCETAGLSSKSSRSHFRFRWQGEEEPEGGTCKESKREGKRRYGHNVSQRQGKEKKRRSLIENRTRVYFEQGRTGKGEMVCKEQNQGVRKQSHELAHGRKTVCAKGKRGTRGESSTC